MRPNNTPELLWSQLRNELHAAKVVVVASVAVESSSVGNEIFPFFSCKTLNLAHCSPLESIKVFLGKVGLEEAEEEGRLVGDLVEHDREACPGRLRHIVGVVLLSLAQLRPAV